MAQLWVYPEELEGTAATSPHAYEACKTASYVLWAFSGRKYHGIRTVTERYECPCSSGNGVSWNVYPRLDGAGVVENRLDNRIGGCDCQGVVAGRHTRLRLRGAPVRSVSKVIKDGTVIDSANYKIVNGSLLQLNGSVDVCGLEITYTYGVPIPTGGRRAARALAEELIKGYENDGECALPDRVTSVSRQGISFTVIDPQDFLDDGRTGVYMVDLFLRAANPDKARKQARVFSPDLPKAYRVTAGYTSLPVAPTDWLITAEDDATWQLDLLEYADLLLQPGWEPQGVISSSSGATLFELGPDRFTIEDEILTVSLTIQEVNSIPDSGAFWDLYGLNIDGVTISHVLSSKIQKTGA